MPDSPTTGPRPIRRALISVSDKSGIVPFARALASRGVALISTGGSARALAEAGLPVTEVAAVTGSPEMLDGRVKTLHPAIHGGLLARRDRPDHLATLAKHGIGEIDLLVSNLYPFAATVASGAGREDCVENIDIGGPALIRGAAKNHEFVTVVTDPADYDAVLGEMAANGGATSLALRRRLARKAYALTAAYDAATAAAIAEIFVEVIIAPEAEPAACEVLAKKSALRLLVTGGMPDPKAEGWMVHSLSGGLLIQERDRITATRDMLKVVTKRAPTESEIADLLFADSVAKHVKSNAIVFAKDGTTVGIGAGQPSRVDSVKIAAAKAVEMGRAAGLSEPPTRGSVVASDAFYPFADGLEAAIEVGATAAIQPGGSRRDAEVIAAADAAGIAMVFTGIRHFRH